VSGPGWVLTVYHSPAGKSWDVRNPAGSKVANVANEDDAKLIVGAVNSHGELVSALLGLLGACGFERDRDAIIADYGMLGLHAVESARGAIFRAAPRG
jgi:hypothetical protein